MEESSSYPGGLEGDMVGGGSGGGGGEEGGGWGGDTNVTFRIRSRYSGQPVSIESTDINRFQSGVYTMISCIFRHLLTSDGDTLMYFD